MTDTDIFKIDVNSKTIEPQSTPLKLLKKSANTQLVTDSIKTNSPETEILKKDINEKDTYIQNLQVKVRLFKDTVQSFRDLIIDLERSTGSNFLSNTQRENLQNMTHNEAISIIRKAMDHIINKHNNLHQDFEKEFEIRANNLSDKMENARIDIQTMCKKREALYKEITRIDRMIKINNIERQSLERISDSLLKQTEQNNNNTQQMIGSIKNHVRIVKNEIAHTRMESANREKKNMQMLVSINMPVNKRHKDMLKDDENMISEINKINKYLEKEINDHNRCKEELEHVKQEIKGVKEIIGKYKSYVNKHTMKNAIRTNRNFREFIAQSRVEAKKNLISVIKKNKDLERTINELKEEEGLLRPYLQSVEKKLQAQMLKLPTLTDLQHKSDIKLKRPLTNRVRKDNDDPEVRAVKKTISEMKNKRIGAKTAFI